MTIIPIYYDSNDGRFNIKVIDEAGIEHNKTTYNTKYSDALSIYINSEECPTIARS
jgi:hypothetical protein